MLDANLADRKVVQYVINRFGIHAKHRLGQNFLVRPDIVAAIADAAEITPDVSVMEIGAGIGTLTQALAERGSDVIAFEVDQSLKRVLDSTLEKYKNVTIIYEDVLKADLKGILGDKEWHCAANLPYYITTPILLSLIHSDLPISLFVFMMQKEVADRILADPGTKDYGALTLAVQYYCTAEGPGYPSDSIHPASSGYFHCLKAQKKKRACRFRQRQQASLQLDQDGICAEKKGLYECR